MSSNTDEGGGGPGVPPSFITVVIVQPYWTSELVESEISLSYLNKFPKIMYCSATPKAFFKLHTDSNCIIR